MDTTLDLVISFDDTGSMSSVRKQVRNNVSNLVKTLFSQMEGVRVGIIIHNDYCDMPQHIFVQDFTTDIDTIKRFVERDSPCGGGDAPECYELALHEASKLSWASDRRVMILIGDEVPHAVGYRYGSHVNSLDWKKETEALVSLGVQVYSVQALGRKSSNYFYDALARMSSGVKLELSQFQHIHTYINAIAYHQQGRLDEYQSSEPSFSANLSLRNMFSRLRGLSDDTGFAEKIGLLSRFQVMDVPTLQVIREFVEMNGCTYSKGKGYYQLVERIDNGHGGTKANVEILQANKEVIFVNKATGEAISDTYWCREQLGIPYGTSGKLYPANIPEVMDTYDVFIQSNSYTRKLDAGTRFLYELNHI
jgi:hypothetical protein